VVFCLKTISHEATKSRRQRKGIEKWIWGEAFFELIIKNDLKTSCLRALVRVLLPIEAKRGGGENAEKDGEVF
jgi:hypothetical protein